MNYNIFNGITAYTHTHTHTQTHTHICSIDVQELPDDDQDRAIYAGFNDDQDRSKYAGFMTNFV